MVLELTFEIPSGNGPRGGGIDDRVDPAGVGDDDYVQGAVACLEGVEALPRLAGQGVERGAGSVGDLAGGGVSLRRADAWRLGGTPNMRRYSRLNCEGLA
jgi:hypothetical protein